MARATAPDAGPVVVGFDGSPAAARAVDVAVDEARRRACDLVVLVVAGSSELWSDSVQELYGDVGAAVTRAALTAGVGVRRAADRCPDLVVDHLVCRDLEASTIADIAGRAQLLVLGGRGERGQHCLSVGATSAVLARAFPCPVLVAAPGPADSTGVVVAGMDGHDSSAAVLRAADTECELRQRDLVAVHAYQGASAPPRHLSEVCWRLFDPAVRARRTGSGRADRLVFTMGTTAEVLTASAGAGDLLVLGTRSRGRLRASDPDDVIRQVLDRATCDVLVVPA